MKSDKTESGPGKWDRRIEELAQAMGEKARQPTTPQIGYDLAANVLRERLVPALDAAWDALSFMLDCPRKGELRRELEKWKTK